MFLRRRHNIHCQYVLQRDNANRRIDCKSAMVHEPDFRILHCEGNICQSLHLGVVLESAHESVLVLRKEIVLHNAAVKYQRL